MLRCKDREIAIHFVDVGKERELRASGILNTVMNVKSKTQKLKNEKNENEKKTKIRKYKMSEQTNNK